MECPIFPITTEWSATTSKTWRWSGLQTWRGKRIAKNGAACGFKNLWYFGPCSVQRRSHELGTLWYWLVDKDSFKAWMCPCFSVFGFDVGAAVHCTTRTDLTSKDVGKE